MQRLVMAETISAMDQKTIEDFGLKSLILMETAGRDSALQIRNRYGKMLFREKRKVLVLCGSGNNGGDGWVVARHLLNWGIRVCALLCTEENRLSPDSLANLELYKKAGGEILFSPNENPLSHLSAIRHAGLFVDALFGVGLDREITGRLAELIRGVNAMEKPLVSLDLPSGIHADTGRILGEAFRADLTLAFGFAKPGLFLEPGRAYSGQVQVVDIGIPKVVSDSFPKNLFLSTPRWARTQIRQRNPDSHKGTYGHLLLVAGAPRTRGAAVLAAEGALRAGCGRLTLAVPETSLPLPGLPPEVMVQALPGNGEGFDDKALPLLSELLSGKTLVAAGSGMGLNETANRILDFLLSSELPLVLDADCLTLLSRNTSAMTKLAGRKTASVLTPHPGEMARLYQKSAEEIADDKIACARNFSREAHCHLLFKGSAGISVRPDGFCQINPTGNPGMATGGSGDVLCGLLASLMAQGFPPEIATPLAPFLHGMAADLLSEQKGPWGYLPSEVARVLPEVFSRILQEEASLSP